MFIVFAGLPLLTWGARVWTDYLWYADLGQTGVFWTRVTSKFSVAAVFGLITLVFVFGNLIYARKLAPKAAPVTPVNIPNLPPQVELSIERLRAGLGPIIDKLVLWGSVAIAVLNGARMAEHWQTFRLALARVPFGVSDPQFGRDAGFYVFQLPAHEANQA